MMIFLDEALAEKQIPLRENRIAKLRRLLRNNSCIHLMQANHSYYASLNLCVDRKMKTPKDISFYFFQFVFP